MSFDLNIANAAEYAELFNKGEEQGFNYMFDLYYPSLCFFAARITGDTDTGKDIASQAFIKTWEKRERLNTFAGIKAYLYQVARNDCYKWLQKQKKDSAMYTDLYAFSAPVAESHLSLLIQTELISQLHHHIAQLPEGCKKVFGKLYIEGKTVSETAKELKLAITTVKTQKQRGLIFLKKRLVTG